MKTIQLGRHNSVLLCIILLCGLPITHAQTYDRAQAHIDNVVLSKVDISPDSFSVCYQYGCEKIANISINPEQWSNLTAIFEENLASGFERALMAEYIARMEQLVGRQTKTQFDRAGTFIMFLSAMQQKSNQMDCIDESINTLSYLKMLEAESILKHHQISGLVTRGGLRAGYPHTAVLLKDLEANKKFVIDSWFLDNGRPAVVLPYKLWKQGWKPDYDIYQ